MVHPCRYVVWAAPTVRHLYMDFTHTVDKEFGRVSALVAIGIAAVLTLVFAYKLFVGY